MKKLIIPLALFILVGALLACGASSNNTGTATTPSSSSSSSTQVPKHFKVGQVVKVGDTWQITVNSVKTSKGDDMNKPTKGQYLLLDVTAKNISNQEQISLASANLN